MKFPLNHVSCFCFFFFCSNSLKGLFVLVLDVSLSINQDCDGIFTALVMMKCEVVCPHLVVASLLP